MGKRSRKRTDTVDRRPAPPPLPEAAPYPKALNRRAGLDEAPKPPWAPFPLVELCVLAGMICILIGFFGGTGPLLGVGFSLVSIAGLELALREHFAGYRSHSSLLAGATAIVSVIPLFFLTGLNQLVLLLLAALVFAAVFQGLRSIFARKTGGLGFRA